MPIIEPEQGSPLAIQAVNNVLSPGTELDPSTIQATEAPGWGESAVRQFVGRIWQPVVGYPTYLTAKAQLSDTVDPNWNPYKQYDAKWLTEHPWMIQYFEDGSILDTPNESHFALLEMFAHGNHDAVAPLENNGFVKNLLTGGPSYAAEFATLGAMGELAGTGRAMSAAKRLIESGSTLARVAKTAGTSAIALGTEEYLTNKMAPGRSLNDTTAAMQAAAAGATLGGLIPLATGGSTALGDYVASAKIHRLQKVFEKDVLTSDDVAAKRGVLASELEGQKQILQDLLAERNAPTVPNAFQAYAMGELPNWEGVRAIVALDHPEIRPLLEQVKAKYGDDLIIGDHPAQGLADFLMSVDNMDKSFKEFAPAKGTSAVADAYVKLASYVTPGGRVRQSPSLFARRAASLFFDDAGTHLENLTNPVTFRAPNVAERMLWDYNNDRDRVVSEVFNSLASELKTRGEFDYQMSNGDVLHIASKSQRKDFGTAIVDYVRQMDEASRQHRMPPENVNPAIRQAAQSWLSYRQRMGLDAKSVGFLNVLDPDTLAVNRRWLGSRIAGARDVFIRKLRDQFARNRQIDFDTGEPINPGSRELDADVVKYLSEADRRAIADAGAKVEGDLPPELQERYLREMDRYLDAAANSTADTLTHLDNEHGIEHAMNVNNANVFKKRLLQVNETDFADFLENDFEKLLSAYHTQTAGQLAIRRAIMAASDYWGPAVKEWAGKDLALENWNPELILETVKAEFQNHRNVVQEVGRGDLLDSINGAETSTMKILEGKIAELQGKLPPGARNARGFRKWSEQNLMRWTTMCMLGRALLSNITDLAHSVMYPMLSKEHLSTTLRALNLFKEMPLKMKEYLYVATSDAMNMTRARTLFDVANGGDGEQFGGGAWGRFWQQSDDGFNWLSRQFFRATGMNRWNVNLKRAYVDTAAGKLMSDVRLMAKAGELVKGGMDEATAIRRVGLSQLDAARLNRLGFNGERSAKLADHLFEKGFDRNGDVPWAGDREAFDKYKGAMFPDYNYIYQTDRDLFHTFTGAVNSEVQNMILEPNLLSRPMINEGIMGRLFNQFQSFAYAWGNQFAVSAAQRPVREQLAYVFYSLGLSALVDALHNELSGRRSLDQTIQLWQEKPQAMVYAALLRSPALGWMARPLGALESSPFGGPAKWMGNDQTSTMYAQNQTLAGIFSPAAEQLETLMRGVPKWVREGETPANVHQQRQLLPYRNWLGFSALQRLTAAMGIDNPFGPGKGIDVYPVFGQLRGGEPAYEAQKKQRPPQP